MKLHLAFCLVMLAHMPCQGSEPLRVISPNNWKPWSARPELMPQTAYQDSHWTVKAGKRESNHGGWDLEWNSVKPGQWYRVSVSCKASEIASIHDHAAVELIWWAKDGKRAEWKHAPFEAHSTGSLEFACTSQAPTNAVAATLRMALRWTDRGNLDWRDARLTEIEPPAPQKFKAAIATAKFPGKSVEANLEFAKQLVIKAADAGAKVVCLPECITTWQLKDEDDADSARPIPGKETDMLCALAKDKRIDIVFSMKEKNGELIHNTGVYIDATKGIVGKYRKTHLAVSERWKGVTPGNEFPVWDTACGTAGMLICYDNVHGEAHKILSQKGAQVIYLPIMGDPRAVGDKGFEKWKQIMSVRAMDNHVWFVVCQNKGEWGMIIRPDGEVMAEISPSSGLAIAEIDLNFRYESWIGSDFENRTWSERRPAIYKELIEDR